MKGTKKSIAKTFKLILITACALVAALPSIAAGQAAPLVQQELMRQAHERQQWLQWQRAEQMRQMYDRQQWLQFLQQERLRQMQQR
jgi:hypothetical protein